MTDRSAVRVLVTGGGQGIGLGIAEGFLRAGAAVAISGRRTDAPAAAADRFGGGVQTIVADVADPQSSITGAVTGYRGLSHYGASKAAQLGFVRSATLELADDGITINAILPGSIRTEGLDGLGADAMAKTVPCIPQRRLGSPADIAAAAQFFASAEASFITGQTLVVDGGQTLPELPDSP